jgi:SAM-dependent methyltransferase
MRQELILEVSTVDPIERDNCPTADEQPYVRFAEIYDSVMRPVGYEMWADYIEELCTMYGRSPGRVLDLACGTGNTSLPFARRGHAVVGVDRSPAMLAVARAKAADEGLPVEFIEGDMRSFALPQPVDLAVCLFDSINYLLDPHDVAAALRAVRQALVPDGLVIFDANTRHRLSQVDDEVLVFDEDDYCLVWRNSYDTSREVWRADLTGFVRDGADGRFARFTEVHEERAYDVDELTWACQEGGLEVLAMFAAFGFSPVASDTSRIYVVAKRPADEAVSGESPSDVGHGGGFHGEQR